MKSDLKKAVVLLLSMLMLVSSIPMVPALTVEGTDGAAAEFAPVENAWIETSKSISYDEATGNYTLRMENYVTGSTITTSVTTMKATDFVLAIDTSKSMPDCINCGAGDVDNPTTGVTKAVSKCQVQPYDLDTSSIYYTATDMTAPVYYCSVCGRWFDTEHTDEIHATGGDALGTEYIPGFKTSYANEFKQFYTQYGNRNCTNGESCTEHNAWSHPIYADQLDITVTYSRHKSSGSGDNTVKYCTVCQLWRRNSSAANTSHAEGGDHVVGYVYHPFRTADDATADVKVSYFYTPCKSRMVAARESVTAFIDEVYKMSAGADGVNGTNDDIGHRVAIVGFAGNGPNSDSKVEIEGFSDDTTYTRTGLYSIWDEERVNAGEKVNNFKTYYVIKDGGSQATDAEYYYSHALRDVTNPLEMDVLEEGTADLNFEYSTYTDYGVIMMKRIFEATYAEDEADGIDRNRVGVVFTDGEPDGDGDGTFDRADESIQSAYEMKINTNYEVTIYSVGIFAKADSSTIWKLSDNTKANIYMHLLSSNYPTSHNFHESSDTSYSGGVRVMDQTENKERLPTINDVNENLLMRDEYGNLAVDADGNYVLDPSKTGYYLTADNADELVNAFEGIATESATGGAYVSLDSSTIVQDTISDEWEIDGDVSGVSAYTMTYTEDDTSGNKIWTKDADTYTPTVNGKTVQVTGFDFSANYVGKDVSNGTETPHGKKLVLEIPVKPAADNTGGTAQLTNDPAQSGIIYDGEVQEHFGSPKADVPTTVTLTLQTVGAVADAFVFDTAAQCMDGYKTGAGGNGNYLEINGKAQSGSVTLSNGGNTYFAQVIVGSSITIKESSVAGCLVEVSLDGGASWTELTVGDDGTATGTFTVTPAMQITVRNTLRNADLTITKTVTRANPDQSFMFSVTGNGDELRVVIPAEAFGDGTTASVTIKDMEIGEYTVRELTDWAFRYTLTGVSAETDTDAAASVDDASITVDLTHEGETVTFTDDRTFIYWLSGDCWKEYKISS